MKNEDPKNAIQNKNLNTLRTILTSIPEKLDGSRLFESGFAWRWKYKIQEDRRRIKLYI